MSAVPYRQTPAALLQADDVDQPAGVRSAYSYEPVDFVPLPSFKRCSHCRRALEDAIEAVHRAVEDLGGAVQRRHGGGGASVGGAA